MRRAALGLVVALAVAAPAGAQPADRDAAVRQWASIIDARNVPTGWTGSTAECLRGAESAESIAATLRTVNALRDFAALPAVTFDPAKNDKALAAALMMDAANDLSHSPGDDWPCSTPEGREAAGNSNLSLGVSGAAAMVGFVDDAGVDSLGHRRWVLDPGAVTFGTGSTGRANALWVLQDPGATPTSPGPPLVAWPPPGWLPWDLVFGTWSAAMNTPGVDASSAQVAVTVDGQPRAVSNLRSLPAGFGSADPTLAWEVALEAGDRGDDHDVTVTISGATLNGAPVPISYTVHAFDASPPEIERLGYRLPRRLRPGRRVKAVVTVRRAVSVSCQWLRAGKPIAGATGRRYRIKKADRGKRIRYRVTATGVGTVIKLAPRLKIPRR